MRCEMRHKPSRLLLRRAISDDNMRCLSSAAIEPEINVDSVSLKPSPSIDATKATPLKESPRRKISNVKISEVLKAKHTSHWVEPVLSHDATIREAIVVCIERKLSAMMVVDRSSTAKKREQKCVGMITSRDLLRMLATDIKEGKSPEDILNDRISKQMLPINQVIYGRPDETIGMCRAVMAKLGIKCLPILNDGRVEGILTSRDLSDFYFDPKDRGGKKNYLENVSERVGLTADTSMAEPPIFVRQQLAMKHAPLYINVGVEEFPHPFKTANGIGSSRRNFGPLDLSIDSDLSEDAHFATNVNLLDENGNLQNMLYMGVADGVGSWREYGVDPREFSHKLLADCEEILRDAQSLSGHAIPTDELLAQSYERTKNSNTIGSSTACVALFDSIHHQLHFSNIGDSGIIVLRHLDSEVSSTLQRNKKTPRLERKSDLRVAFVSQQQLQSFNHPYQLGWTGEETKDKDSSFKKASDSCTSSVHILRGDIIIMATDGLFDNVDIDDVADICLQWERDNGFVNGSRKSKQEASDLSAKSISSLARILCEKARENSLDSTIDSPFALLAKDNDIMWSGGMPDDCTVVAMHVVGSQSHSL